MTRPIADIARDMLAKEQAPYPMRVTAYYEAAPALAREVLRQAWQLKDGEARPCPICGTQPEIGDCHGDDESGEVFGYSYVECPASGHFCGVHADTVKDALAIWNGAAPPMAEEIDKSGRE